MNQQQSSIYNILYGILGGAGRIVAMVIVAFVQYRLVFKFLPKDLAGIWFLYLSIAYCFAFFDLGISPTVTRELSFILGDSNCGEQEKNKRIADMIATCQQIFRVISLCVFILGMVLGTMYLLKIAPAGRHRDVVISWCIFTFGASVNILGGAGFAALDGLGNIATERIIRSIMQMVGLTLSVAALYMGFGIMGLAMAWVCQGLIERYTAWLFLYRLYPHLKLVKGKAESSIARRLAMPSLKWAIMGLGSLLIFQTNNIIIASVLGPSYIPNFEAASKIAMTLATFSLLFATSSSPFLSMAYASDDIDIFKALLLRNVRYGTSFMVIVVAFLALFGDRVINLWLGKGNFIGFSVLWALLTMCTLEVHHVNHAIATMATGRVIFHKAALTAGVLNIILSSILVRYFGLLGIGLGMMISQMVTNNWYAPYITLKTFNIPVKQYLIKVLIPISLLFIIMLICNIVMRRLTSTYSDLTSILIALPVSGMIALVIGASLIMTSSERKKIYRKVSNWRMLIWKNRNR